MLTKHSILSTLKNRAKTKNKRDNENKVIVLRCQNDESKRNDNYLSDSRKRNDVQLNVKEENKT